VTTPLDPDQQTASAIIQKQLADWGLGSLAGVVNDLIRQGLGSDAITLQLQASPEYKQRFKANDARVANGLAALSPAEYIATENAYRQVLQQYGLPAQFYDQQSDFQSFLERDVSPDEVKSRADVAQQIWLGADEGVKSVWKDWYGLSDGAAIASILDDKTALPIVQSMAAAAQGGAAARRSGLTADEGRLRGYVDSGISASQINQGFSEIGQTLGTDQAIARRFGQSYTQADAEAARIAGIAPALKRQQALYDSEQALFQGRAAADAQSLKTNTSGRY